MATCKKCGKQVGCGCNLISGKCHVCFSEDNYSDDTMNESPTLKKKSTKRVRYSKLSSGTGDTAEFNQILKMKNISRKEKVKRINSILEKAKKDAVNKS